MGTSSVPGGYTVWSSLWIPALKNMQWDREFINQKAEGNCWHALKFRADSHTMLQLHYQSTPRSRVHPGSISVLVQGIWTTTRLGKASAGARLLLWGALSCHSNMDSSTVESHKPFPLCSAGWQSAHSNIGVFAQAMYPERAGPGRNTDTNFGLCFYHQGFKPGTLQKVGTLLTTDFGAGELQLCWSFLNSDLHPHGTATRTGLCFGRERRSSARNSNNINHLWPSELHQWPQNITTKCGLTKSCCPGWVLSVWLLHPLHPPASLVLPALLSSSAEGSWAPHELQQKLLKSWKPDD